MSTVTTRMPILLSFYFLVVLLFVDGAEKDDIKDTNANRREIYDEKTDSWGFVEDLKNHKRESSDVDTTVDDLMHSLQGICFFDIPKQSANQLLKDTQSILKNIDVYRDIVKLNIQLRNKLKWIVEGKYKGTIEVSRVIRMLKNDVQDIYKPLDLETPRDCAELKKKHKKSGNETIHVLTTSGRYELRIDLSDWTGNKWYAIYKTFSVGNENTKYKLNVGVEMQAFYELLRIITNTLRNVTINHGNKVTDVEDDGMAFQNGMKFSTKDQDNDKKSRDCAKLAKGGWWYADCHEVNLNGIYKAGQTSKWDVVSWNKIKKETYSMKFARMMIRRF
ncbi:Hypothetical predicted protein [Mytilus galloprovincialis]|uniref:Fibrinogen C-terminal domain-containing protein n=1 Tax=Mytilus galloprovincialis TaxID=29158 RepID=A0A8B6HC27_MYTGA|nr:Hypothetical predicted protein [Mytilus galloprovincialis]